MEVMQLIWMTMMVNVVMAAEQWQKTPEVQVQAGSLRGVVKTDGLRGYYHSYLGIPYARAEKRFQAATPVTPWEGIFEANNDSVRCAQVTFPQLYLIQPSIDIVDQEDCLTLNIHTPVPLPGSALKPVLVFIFGGGFMVGSSSSRVYGPEYLIQNDVILVTINYRVDALGFLCLGINEAPGNIGFKDQVEALRWVKQNIQAFGGDPNNVILFGESAGGASVMMHVVSPMSQGLFHKVIAESGSNVNPWSFVYDPLALAIKITTRMGYSTQDPHEIYNILMNKTAIEILSTRVPRHPGDTIIGDFVYGACVEKELDGVERFLPDLPYNLLKSGQYAKVPMLVGHSSNEGFLITSLETPATLKNITFYDSLPRNLFFPTEEEAKATAAKLEELYMCGKPISTDTVLQVSNYVGDTLFIYPFTETADILMKTNDKPVFAYDFAYFGKLSFGKYQSGFGTEPGATHTDILYYNFRHSLSSVNELVESTILQRMSTMWTNFAKYGEPVPEETALLPIKWLPLSENNQNKFVIDTEFSISPLWNSEQLLYLNQTYSKYRRTDFNV